jgi:hypothetical protein
VSLGPAVQASLNKTLPRRVFGARKITQRTFFENEIGSREPISGLADGCPPCLSACRRRSKSMRLARAQNVVEQTLLFRAEWHPGIEAR